jgi:hypothetical protein
MYVTWKKPKAGTELYHTPVHIGCAAANEKDSEKDIFDNIWKKFEGTDICINKVKIDRGAVVDDAAGKLYYYGIDATLPGWTGNPVPPGEPGNTYSVARDKQTATTKDLLIYRDGRCGAWASFYKDILLVQNITCSNAHIITKSIGGKARLIYVNETKGVHHGEKPREKSWSDHAVIYSSDANLCDTSYGINYKVVNLNKEEDFIKVARIFDQYGEITFRMTPTGSYVIDHIDWLPGTNATSKWITITIEY